MALRAALHAGRCCRSERTAPSEYPARISDSMPCSCGRQARYKEMRTKPSADRAGSARKCSAPITGAPAVARASSPPMSRWTSKIPSFLPGCAACWHWWARSAPRSITAASRCKLLAGLEVTAKSVERTRKAIGADIAQREQDRDPASPATGSARRRWANRFPMMYVQMDGTGVPVVKQRDGGAARQRTDGRAHTREAKLGCVFTQTTLG